MHESKRPFFIIGAPRSGTTLLVQILNRHRNVFVPPETHFFTFVEHYIRRWRRPTTGENFNIDLPRLVDDYMERPFYRNLGISEPRIREVLAKDASGYGDVFDNLMQYLLAESGKTRWGEKTPTHLHTTDRILERYPDAQFILLYRDGRAVVRSHFSVHHWNDNWYSYARQWNRCAEAGQRLIETLHSDRLLQVRYEDLVTAPTDTVREICAFLGEEYTPKLLQADDSYSRQYRVYKREWMSKSTEAVDPRRAQAWEHEYPTAALRLVEALTQKQLTLLGYDLRGPKSRSWIFLFLVEFTRDFGHRAWRRVRGRIHLRERVGAPAGDS